VALSTLNDLLRSELSLFPTYWISHNLGLWNVLYGLIVHSSDHVHRLPNLGYRCVSARWRHPSFSNCLCSYFGAETLPLLHPLNIALKTSSQFFSQFVARYVFCGISSESASRFIIWTFRLNKQRLLFCSFCGSHRELSLHGKRIKAIKHPSLAQNWLHVLVTCHWTQNLGVWVVLFSHTTSVILLRSVHY